MPTRLLLIDDGLGDRDLVRQTLADTAPPLGPLHVTYARGWREAASYVADETLDLILLDVRLPAPTGVALLGELRRYRHAPVVVLSVEEDLAAAVATLRAGACDYVCKRGDWTADLRRALARALPPAGRSPAERRTRAIEELYVRTEEMARMKSEIVANVSHELRTPLNSVLGYAELLDDHLPPDGTPEAREILDALRQQALRLNAVIASVLSVERLRSAREPVVVSRFPLSALVEELRADAMILNADKGLVITWKGPRRDVSIEHDRVKIRAIASQLISNAIKFTPAGSTQVAVARTADGGLALEVRDTGIGIPAEACALIFEDFLQLDGSSTRRYQGLGLGLGIVKRYTALLRGTVRARPTPGGGTTVRVELPPPSARRKPVDAA